MKCADNSLAYYCLLAIMSGSVLAATAFAPHWILQLPAILATAPIFWLLRNVSVIYVCGRRVFYARLADTDDILVLYFHAAWRCVCGKRRMGGIGL